MSTKLKIFVLSTLVAALVTSGILIFVSKMDTCNPKLVAQKAYNGNVEGIIDPTVTNAKDTELINQYIVTTYGTEYIQNPEKAKELQYSNWTWILEQINKNKNLKQ